MFDISRTLPTSGSTTRANLEPAPPPRRMSDSIIYSYNIIVTTGVEFEINHRGLKRKEKTNISMFLPALEPYLPAAEAPQSRPQQVPTEETSSPAAANSSQQICLQTEIIQ